MLQTASSEELFYALVGDDGKGTKYQAAIRDATTSEKSKENGGVKKFVLLNTDDNIHGSRYFFTTTRNFHGRRNTEGDPRQNLVQQALLNKDPLVEQLNKLCAEGQLRMLGPISIHELDEWTPSQASMPLTKNQLAGLLKSESYTPRMTRIERSVRKTLPPLRLRRHGKDEAMERPLVQDDGTLKKEGGGPEQLGKEPSRMSRLRRSFRKLLPSSKPRRPGEGQTSDRLLEENDE
ncbi:hypothetical protein FOL47_004022 [Perkinsus chesapeaki]|uniref:Uncharacterized protein n=1 Tax=Perkinsus chesapeaki TaxID=330153 RepID=A0A7J6M4Z3_PERCH|nr:hypothetical protein FOL47_004022 [Perkinsus chesapeaki]